MAFGRPWWETAIVAECGPSAFGEGAERARRFARLSALGFGAVVSAEPPVDAAAFVAAARAALLRVVLPEGVAGAAEDAGAADGSVTLDGSVAVDGTLRVRDTIADGTGARTVEALIRPRRIPDEPTPAEIARLLRESVTSDDSWPGQTLARPVPPDGPPAARSASVLLLTLPGTPVLPAEHVPSLGEVARLAHPAGDRSPAMLLRRLIELRRREPAFWSPAPVAVLADTDVVAYVLGGAHPYLVALGLGEDRASLALPTTGVIALSTRLDRADAHVDETLRLRPREGLVVRLVPASSAS